jgi:hypothetical protein
MSDVLQLRGEGIEWREIEGEIVALETGQSLYLAANPSGTVLWERLAEGTTRAELVAALQARWPIDEDRAARDVDAFIDAARSHGLLG